MTTAMKASFTLTLEDKLSAGLDHIKQALEGLRQKGNNLTLGGLQRGGDVIQTLAREVRNLTSDLRGVTGAADRAWGSLKRIGSAGANWGRRTFGEQSRVGAFASAAEGYSVVAPIKAYAEQENTLRHIAITEKLSGPAVEQEVARLDLMLRREAMETGQNSQELAKAYNFLITTGMSRDLVDKLMPAHARAATAYNVPSDSMGQAVFALNDSFKIGHDQMGEALSAMAYAAKEAHFTVENFSQFLPAIGGRMQLLGMTGRPAADTAFAALETVVKNSSMPSQAATNLQDLLQYMTAPIATRSFAKQGIDLPAMLRNAEKQGINPLDAFLGKLDQLTRGRSPVDAAEIIGKLVHNQEAASAALSLLQHRTEYLAMRDRLGTVSRGTLDTDFQTAHRAPEVQVRTATEEFEELTRRVGGGFAPLLHVVNAGMAVLIHGFDWLDTKLPGVGSGLLLVAGSMLSLGAAVGALGVVGPIVVTGFKLLTSLLLTSLQLLVTGFGLFAGMMGALGSVIGTALAALVSPIGLVIAAIAALAVAGYDIYENWQEFRGFFSEMWSGIKDIFWGAVDFVAGVFTGDMARAERGLERAWDGIKTFFSGLWGTVKQLFSDFTDWVDGWTAGAMTGAVQNIKAAWDGLRTWFSALWADIRAPFDRFVTDLQGSWIGRHLGLMPQSSSSTDAPTGTGRYDRNDGVYPQGELHIRVSADPGTNATVTRAPAGATVTPNPGPATGLP